MEGSLVFKDCAVLRSDGRTRSGLAIRVEGDVITQAAPTEQVPVLPGDWEVRCDGRLVAPGWMDCHAHLVNGPLGRGASDALLRSDRARFELQQARDAALTVAEVEVLAAFEIARALRRGVTFIAEHLHCPQAPGAALEQFARTAERLGARALVSHSTRDADADAPAHAEANAQFVKRWADHPTVRGAMGFHASHSCGDALLTQIAQLRQETGAHVLFHAAESELDLTQTFQAHGTRVIQRLERLGLVGRWSVASLARAVDREEADRLFRAQALIAVSPRLDLWMETGSGGFDALVGRENRLAFGTCGGGALADEVTCATADLLRLARSRRLVDPDGTLLHMLFAAPAELVTTEVGKPSGIVEEGALADLVVYDWIPPEDAAPVPDVVAQLSRAPVAWTVVGGRVVVREGQLLGQDERELSREAARVLASRAKRA